MSGSITTRVRRGARRFVLGSGPLKRTSDRVQLAGRLLVLLSLLAAVPLAVLVAGIARSHLEASAAAQAAGSHEARAVVLADTGDTLPPAADPAAPDATTTNPQDAGGVRAEVSWHGADGGLRHAAVVVAAGTPVGATVPVWVDRGGNLTDPPPDAATVNDDAVAVGLAVAAGLPLLVWSLHTALRVVLDATRTRRWGREWERVDREWRAHQN
jgi:hypothetical protein